MDTAMIQYNYLDTDFQATEKGLDYAYLKNVAVVVMEPLRGGKLVQSSAPIEQILTEAPIKRTLAEWAFDSYGIIREFQQYLGMSTMEQVKENIRYAQEAFPNSFGDDDFTIISRLKESYLSKLKVPCTNCHYCMPCPEGVDIPENFNLINHAAWEGGVKNWIKKWYDELDDPDIASDWHGKGKASKCIQCGECVDKCPQNIDIPAVLEEMTAILKGVNPKLKAPSFHYFRGRSIYNSSVVNVLLLSSLFLSGIVLLPSRTFTTHQKLLQ
jgi:predicted aldo/keto reductase-like oxidoreductase